MTRWMLLFGFLAAIGCATATGIDEGVGAGGQTGGVATSGGSSNGGAKATGGTQDDSGETGGKDQGDGTGGKTGDETGGTQNTGGQQATETGGVPPAGGGVDEALYGKLELSYQPSGTTQFVLDLTNDTGRDLNTAGIEIRYWMTPEGALSEAVCECYSVQGAIKTCDDVTRTFVEGPPAYLQITFGVPATYRFWGTTDQVSTIKALQIAIHRKDYQNDDMTNDYSYQQSSGGTEELVPNEKITVYYEGKLVWGVEPEG
jgi:hypothetical protein